MSNYLTNCRNHIDYLTSMSRYWISQGDWDSANVYIDKVISAEVEYNTALRAHNNSKEMLIIEDFNN